jgi:hypothetical protein
MFWVPALSTESVEQACVDIVRKLCITQAAVKQREHERASEAALEHRDGKVVALDSRQCRRQSITTPSFFASKKPSGVDRYRGLSASPMLSLSSPPCCRCLRLLRISMYENMAPGIASTKAGTPIPSPIPSAILASVLKPPWTVSVGLGVGDSRYHVQGVVQHSTNDQLLEGFHLSS